MDVRRGDILFVNVPEGVGSEQQGDRVALVVSADVANAVSPIITVLLGTKYNKKDDQQSQFVVSTDYGLKFDTVFMAEQIIRIDKQRIKFYITYVDNYKMKEAEKAMSVALGMSEFFNVEYVKAIIEKINKIDAESLLHPDNKNKRLDVINELNTYCEKFGYNSRVFLDKYLLFKEVELCG
jgi:mRNA-degrading endonuclease toxin of MazEF toxin-antitoxin module